MLGILVILIVSWLLLYFIENKNLMVLGFLPISKVIMEFSIGVLFILIITLIFVGIDTFVNSIVWQINPTIDYYNILDSILYNLRSAITEDLVFRGALLYILVSKLGIRLGTLLSAVVFGIYHWFSYGLLPGEFRLFPLLYVFIITGSIGYVWAYAYIKTQSIMMPLGFHLGSNFIYSLYFKNAAYGELVFTEVSRIGLGEGYLSFFYLISKGVATALITLIFVKFWVKKHVE